MTAATDRTPTVLITRFSAIGDVVMTIPVIYSVCLSHPEVQFLMVTRKPLQSIFVNAPHNLTVIGVDLKNEYSGLLGMRRLLNELRKSHNITAYADLHDVLRTKFMRKLTVLHRIPTAHIHKGRTQKRRLTRSHNKQLTQLPTTFCRYSDVFRRLGFKADAKFDGIFGHGGAPATAYAGITDQLSEQPGQILIGIAPFAKHPGKIYPPELMEQTIKLLTANPNVKLFLFGGGESERIQLREWAERYPNTISLAEERHGFATEMALMSKLDAMLTMDSANLHLASIAGTRVVSIWGATHPFCGFGGWNENANIKLQAPLDCRPCSVYGNRPCLHGDYRCMRAITPQAVADALINAATHRHI